MHHASFAMNLYYQANGRHLADCNFINSGLVSLIDPSYGNCSFHSGGGLADEEPSETWCVAKPGTSDELLQLNINFACNLVDCNATHSGGVCYYPATLINHASYAMNLYYQITGRKKSNCNFRETSLIVSSDPKGDQGHFLLPSAQQVMGTVPTLVSQCSEKKKTLQWSFLMFVGRFHVLSGRFDPLYFSTQMVQFALMSSHHHASELILKGLVDLRIKYVTSRDNVS
ncbi:hypothetical protein GOBAR_AA35700 [Gossypium barbadense]|uniref:X8 domain-containing protein n=1 Tax=Gossypium barbadense TaxID=3634 RepID=A0A2P5W1P1_GOSBA|nr:hypothetical protein GOBAR_AA35700 [Gossypium barbadense]